MDKILSGIRVLDFTDRLAGPYCTRYLADCGCEVINIEPPGGADSRGMPFFFDGQSTDFMYPHCGKKSFNVNLKAPGARELIMDLAKVSDVVVENFRPGVMKKFGLDYPAFEKVNPGIVMCSISGFGQEGPYAQWMAADIAAQAASGYLDATTATGDRPKISGMGLGDILAGLTAFGAINAALYRRTITGKGDYIDISLMDCLFGTLYNQVGKCALSEEEGEVDLSFLASHLSPRAAYKGRDGYMILSAYKNEGFELLAELMEKPELANDPRFNSVENRVAHDEALTVIIDEWLQTTFTEVNDAAALLQSYRIMASPVLPVSKVIKHPQTEVREMLKEVKHRTLGPVKYINIPIRFQHSKAFVEEPPAAYAGEHNDYVLGQILGLNREAIEELKGGGIVCGAE
jgi:CoA:oxalate CoA-transferase